MDNFPVVTNVSYYSSPPPFAPLLCAGLCGLLVLAICAVGIWLVIRAQRPRNHPPDGE